MRYLLVGALGCFFLSSPVFGQVNFTSSNLPIIVIDTHMQNIGDEPKITADMGIIDNGGGQRNNITDPFNNYNGKIGIEYRGSSSQGFPKKPYAIELRDDAGNGISQSILGMPAEEDWALIATYNDKTLIRDALAYKMGRDLMRYAPRIRFVELVLKQYSFINGEWVASDDYQGVYMVAEKIKRDKNRVDIAKLEPDEISGDDLTGGYILKIDKSSGNSGAGFNSRVAPSNRNGGQVINFQYEYPAYDEIVSQQKQYIQNYINTFEAVLGSSTYDDKVNGYRKYIDVDSFVDFLIINEVSKNVDGYRLSTFLYKDKDSKGGKLVMGPVWDFNLAFGNANYCEGGPIEGWMYNFNFVCNGDFWLIPFWWKKLMDDPYFYQKLALRWQELRADKLATTKVFGYIDSLSNVLKVEAAARNFTKWPVLNEWVWPNVFVGPTYESEVSWMKNWIQGRLQWLDINFPWVQATANEDVINSDIFSVEAYPNPFVNQVTVDYSIRKPGNVSIELFDMMGKRKVKLDRSRTAPGKYQEILNDSNLARGVYILKIVSSSSEKSATTRVIKIE